MVFTKNKYNLPIRRSSIVLVISDPNTHSDFLEFALDFLLPEGSEVLAACDGKVVDVKVDSKEGGLSEKYQGNEFLNYITIEHKNKELSQYAHLKFGGACVKVGQGVKSGEVIGYSGNTGFSSAPHLHFHVCILNDSDVGWETISIDFDEKLKVIRSESDLTDRDRVILEKFHS